MSEALSSPSKSPAVQPWNQVGIDPSDIIGKLVKQVRKSCTHPTVTIDFDDDTSVQIRVDGYDPQHPGLPKALETDSHLEELMVREVSLDIPVLGCATGTNSMLAWLSSSPMPTPGELAGIASGPQNKTTKLRAVLACSGATKMSTSSGFLELDGHAQVHPQPLRSIEGAGHETQTYSQRTDIKISKHSAQRPGASNLIDAAAIEWLGLDHRGHSQWSSVKT